MTIAICRKCGHRIERTPLGGWGTRVHVLRGCRHQPVKGSEREEVTAALGGTGDHMARRQA